MLTVSLDSKIHLVNKFLDKLSLKSLNVILTCYLPAINSLETFPKEAIANKFIRGNQMELLQSQARIEGELSGISAVRSFGI